MTMQTIKKIAAARRKLLESFSTHTLETIFFWSTCAALLFGGVGLVAAFVAGFTGYEAADREIKLSHEKIRASDVKIAEANEQAASANNKTEVLRRENLDMGMLLLPRRLILSDIQSEMEELKKYPGTHVLVQSVPDWEASVLAADIHNFLTRFGHWNVSEIAAVPPGLIREGVTIATLDETPLLPGVQHTINMSPPAKALFDMLKKELGPPRTREFEGVMWSPVNAQFARVTVGDFKIPPGVIVILVGAKPMSRFPMVARETLEPAAATQSTPAAK